MSNWPSKIYVATTALGVYYTENFQSPDIQPTWSAINAGLPSLDVREFWTDPFYPNTYQYLILESSREIYRRANHMPWSLVLSPAMLPEGGSIGGFCCDPSNKGMLLAMCGAPNVVYDPDYYYIMVSGDYGATWQRDGDAGGGTIWTYGLGSIRSNNGAVYWFTSQDLGAHASINNSHLDWNYVPWAVIDPDDLNHPYTTYDITGDVGLGKVISVAGEAVTLVELQDGLGPGFRCDTMWFNNSDSSHSRIVKNGHLYSTRDSWETIETTTGQLQDIYSICPINTHEDINQMFVGQAGQAMYERRHVIGALYGEDETEFVGIAGSQALVEPYTSSIPWNAGGIAQNGIQAIVSASGAYTYAVAMPNYVGPDRGEPLAGDRSAWDTNHFPERHSRDLGLDPPVHHVPAPKGAESWIYSEDGLSWTTIRMPLSAFGGMVRETILTFSGELLVSDNPYKVYNLFGGGQVFNKVFLSVASAPIGQDIIVDIHQNGTTIFENQNNRPRIVAGDTTGYTTNFNTPLWQTNNYLTAHIDQVGTSYKGSYLVVHIVHGSGVFTSTAIRSAYMMGGFNSTKHAHVTAPAGMVVHAYLRGPDPEKSSKSAYLYGTVDVNDNKAAYLYGVSQPKGSASAYLQGGY